MDYTGIEYPIKTNTRPRHKTQPVHAKHMQYQCIVLQDALADLRELVIIFDRPMHLLVRRPQLEKTGLENVL